MNKRRWRWIAMIGFGLLAATIAACAAPTPAVSHGGPVRDHVSFVDALRARGLAVEIAGGVEQPFLRGNGTLLRVSGGSLVQPAELQSFNYDDRDLGADGLKIAADDASQIEPSGNPKTARISWIAPPHFFRKGRVIVIYLGGDVNALALLTELLGPQFAGR